MQLLCDRDRWQRVLTVGLVLFVDAGAATLMGSDGSGAPIGVLGPAPFGMPLGALQMMPQAFLSKLPETQFAPMPQTAMLPEAQMSPLPQSVLLPEVGQQTAPQQIGQQQAFQQVGQQPLFQQQLAQQVPLQASLPGQVPQPLPLQPVSQPMQYAAPVVPVLPQASPAPPPMTACSCNATAPEGFIAGEHAKGGAGELDGCHISKVVVHEDHPSEVGGLSFADVTAAYGGGGLGELSSAQRGMVQLAHVASTPLMCLDDRLTDPVMATPGGDLGEFALALASYYQEKDPTGKSRPTQEAVDTLFKNYLDILPSDRHLVFCTDERAIAHLETVLPAENLDLRVPPMHAKEYGLLEHLMEVEGQGDSHFRLMLKQPEWYQLDKDLIPMVLRSFFSFLWAQNLDPSNPLHASPKLDLKVLAGQSSPQAFFEVTSCQTCQDKGVAPKMTPHDGVRSVLVSHLDAASVRRQELAAFFSRIASATPRKIDREKLHQRLDRHGWLALETTGSRIAAGLPFYTLDYV